MAVLSSLSDLIFKDVMKLRGFAGSLLIGCTLFVLILCLHIQSTTAHADDNLDRASKIRAALLYYIAKFVELSPVKGESINICLVGSDSMEDILPSTVEGKLVSGFPIKVQSKKTLTPESISTCSLVFLGTLSDSELTIVNSTLTKWEGLSVCSEHITTTLNQCVIRLFEENNKARIAVNRNRANKNKVTISSELLDVVLLE